MAYNLIKESLIKFKEENESLTDYFLRLEENNLESLRNQISLIKRDFMKYYGLDLEATLQLMKFFEGKNANQRLDTL